MITDLPTRLPTKGKNIEITAPETITLTAKNITMNAGQDILMNAARNMQINTGNDLSLIAGNQALMQVMAQMLIETPFLTQLVSNYLHTQAGKALINSQNEIKVESPETYISGQNKLFLHSDQLATLNSKGTAEMKSQNGNMHSNKADAYQIAQPETDADGVVHFLPGKGFDGDYGFDWMRLGKEGDNKINFAEICNSFDVLENEYKASIAPGMPKKDDGSTDKYYCSWLALYPQTDSAGKSSVKLTLRLQANNDMTQPFEFVYNEDYLSVTPNTLPPIKKTKKDGKEEENAITVTCKKGFGKEVPASTDGKPVTDPREIKVVVASATEKDTAGNPVKKLAGRLMLLPNDDDNRFRLKVRLVKVLIDHRDDNDLDRQIKINDIKTWLSQKSFNQCLIKPEIDMNVTTLDITAKYDELKSDVLITNPDSSGATFGSDKEVVDASSNSKLDKLASIIKSAYYDYRQKNNIDDDYGLVYFFVNYTAVDFYSETSTPGGTSKSWGTTKGRTNTPGKDSIIYKGGITRETITHEGFHSLGLQHTFEPPSKYIFEEYKTDNIMDYAEDEAGDAKLINTYHWQWEKARLKTTLISETDWAQQQKNIQK